MPFMILFFQELMKHAYLVKISLENFGDGSLSGQKNMIRQIRDFFGR